MASTTGLGHGLELRDGDLALDDGRLAEVDGLSNLVQALTLRVLTPYGSDRFTTTYGLDVAAVFAQATSTRTAQDLLRLSLVRTIGSDPRVREIRDVVVLDPPAGGDRRLWQIEITIVAVDGIARTLPLEVGI